MFELFTKQKPYSGKIETSVPEQISYIHDQLPARMPESALELIKFLLTDNLLDLIETASPGRNQINYKKIKNFEFFKTIDFD